MDAAWETSLFELIRRTATSLPADIEAELRRAHARERKGSRAWWVLGAILRNVDLARQNDAPLCQDTGLLTFYFRVPVGFDTNALVGVTRAAVSRATRTGHLRQNALDVLTGGAYATNIAPGSPVFHFRQGARKVIDARLLMKGGGCENVSRQYTLPDAELGAGRDLDGARRCVLDAVYQAQGNGCPPGLLGVCIGGDRAGAYAHAEEQFLRKLEDRSPIHALARFERKIAREARDLRIGPMGLGGKATLLGVKTAALCRIPACYFVTVSYMCWACRRQGITLGQDGEIGRWLYR